jgi:hypothetical protein
VPSSLDIGARQSSGLALGTRQPSGTVEDSITCGVSAGVSFTALATAAAAITLAVSTDEAFTTRVVAPGAVELDVDAGSSLVAGRMDNQFIALHVDVAVTPSIQVGAGDAIALGVDAHTGIVEQETYGATRRGKSAVVVTAKSTGKSTVR